METKEAIAAVIKEDGLDSAIAWIAGVVDEKHNRIEQLETALQAMLHAVCSPTGFAAAVRTDSGKAYPWVTLEYAEKIARAALGEKKE